MIDDRGGIYGPGGDAPFDSLGFDVVLPEIPPADRLLSATGARLYRAGQRPDPADVFYRVVDTVDRFIDFDRSLAGQRTMAEMTACYILATWFLDAFNVIGFLWPNGERGSGKTQLLTLIAELSYLGQVILAGGSFASLRDLADYGATLAFDDAENLSDPRRTDPDKRALLLAGNRKGNTVPLKEPTANGTWRTRYVNTFCPRLFSAIRLPDEVLASRTIVVPLIRTPDRYRANADILTYGLWPHHRRQLIDDLWSLALAHLAELPGYENQVNQRASLVGRSLEPWRAILAVALWLDDNGVGGLWERVEKLSQDYQTERPELESSDLTVLVIRALCRYAVNAVCAVNIEGGISLNLKTAQIADAVKGIASDIEADVDERIITSRRIGRVMAKLRFASERDGKSKGWRVSLSELEKLSLSYGLPFDDFFKTNADPLYINGTNGTNGITAQTAQNEILEGEI